jgi:hypothetical protein
MKLRLDVDEKYPVYTVHEVSEVSTRLFAWDAVEMSETEWQDYQAVAKAWDDWQKRLGKWMVERVPPTQPEAQSHDEWLSELNKRLDPGPRNTLLRRGPKQPFLGHGRVWDGRTSYDRKAVDHQAEDDGA